MTLLMDIFEAADLDGLVSFPDNKEPLGILEREAPEKAGQFFQKLMSTSFGVAGRVSKSNAEHDIKDILKDEIPTELQQDPFYKTWIADMAEVCTNFCDMQGDESIGFWLGSDRGCSRYHVDNVPLRMLVTYAGKGTEVLPDFAADRKAYENKAPNQDIIKDPSAIRFMNAWDVAVFRGGPKGLLHRTPDEALNGPSILMRLDHHSFWDRVLQA